ncbi:MAG: hypothetical protein GXP17_07775 [Gammaproteobacteria bacterium]|nr:hypothetical protein [Gammaproteobacteria bacterium]
MHQADLTAVISLLVASQRGVVGWVLREAVRRSSLTQRPLTKKACTVRYTVLKNRPTESFVAQGVSVGWALPTIEAWIGRNWWAMPTLHQEAEFSLRGK